MKEKFNIDVLYIINQIIRDKIILLRTFSGELWHTFPCLLLLVGRPEEAKSFPPTTCLSPPHTRRRSIIKHVFPFTRLPTRYPDISNLLTMNLLVFNLLVSNLLQALCINPSNLSSPAPIWSLSCFPFLLAYPGFNVPELL